MKFAESGIRKEASDDQCSICLEDFCESNPSTVMNSSCRDEFHFHPKCILESFGRSSSCPSCAQHVSSKDFVRHGLLGRVEQNRGQENFRLLSMPGREKC